MAVRPLNVCHQPYAAPELTEQNVPLFARKQADISLQKGHHISLPDCVTNWSSPVPVDQFAQTIDGNKRRRANLDDVDIAGLDQFVEFRAPDASHSDRRWNTYSKRFGLGAHRVRRVIGYLRGRPTTGLDYMDHIAVP
jgi:hypothetical protein